MEAELIGFQTYARGSGTTRHLIECLWRRVNPRFSATVEIMPTKSAEKVPERERGVTHLIPNPYPALDFARPGQDRSWLVYWAAFGGYERRYLAAASVRQRTWSFS